MPAWESYLEEHANRFVEELTEFLRIPSVSSLSEHVADVERAAQWVAERLRAAGMEAAEVLPTGGHPVVYGKGPSIPSRPTVLIYGHFDVQPPDPLDLWTHPPFSPHVDDSRIWARGASDDKGNMLAPILAAEALMKTTDTLPVNVKFFFEGQEEIGSPQIEAFITGHRELLACDVVLGADGSQWDENQPVVVAGRRGLCALQVDVYGANQDVHSGTYGGSFLNPIHALAHLLASLHDDRGRVCVEGFYDAVESVSEEERRLLAEIPFDEQTFRAKLGVRRLYGDPSFTPTERIGIRPTLEVNGIWGGFQGEGVKTVIPAAAHAKITCRLVPDQDPQDIVEKVSRQIRENAPDAVSVRVTPLPGSGLPYKMATDHPGNRAAASVLSRLYGTAPYIARMGGTIPVCGLFLRHLDAAMVNFSFGLGDENIHAPDEFFRLQNFRRAQRAYCMILEELVQHR